MVNDRNAEILREGRVIGTLVTKVRRSECICKVEEDEIWSQKVQESRVALEDA
jgi:hypothetical protein